MKFCEYIRWAIGRPLAGSFLPAHRAAGIEPMEALRAE